MPDRMPDPRKVEAGRKGGRTTAAKYGSDYMTELGKLGAEALYKKYRWMPYKIGQYALVEIQTGNLIAVR